MIKFFKNTDPAQRRSAGNIFKFLAVLLAFTLIARGTSGATLARVTLASPTRSDIIDAISGTATVYSTDTLEITAPEGLAIAEILVGAGQYVNIGDPVAVFELDDLEERHIRETASLSRMNLELKQLERGEAIDTSPLETARRNLRQAEEDYAAAVRQGEADIAEAREALNLLIAATYEDPATLPSAIRGHQRALEDYNATLAQGQADIAEAEEALRSVEVSDVALQNAIRSHQRARDDYNATLAQAEADIAAAREALEEARERGPSDADRSALETALRNYQRARDDYNTARRQGEESLQAAELALYRAIAAYHNAVFMSQLEPDPAAVAAAWAEVERAQNAITTAQNTAEANLLTASRRVEDERARLDQARRTLSDTAQGEIEQLENAIEAAETALENAETQAANRILAASRTLEDEENRLAQAQRDFVSGKQAKIEQLETALQTARDRAENNLRTAARRVEDEARSVSTQVEQAQQTLQTAINRAQDTRRTEARRVETERAALATAERRHGEDLRQSENTTAQNVINLTTLQLDIAAQITKVHALETLISNNGVLYASVAGAISVATENGVTTGTGPIITLRDTQGGFEATMEMPRRDAEQLTIGSEATVTTDGGSIFFTPTVTGVVTGISQPDENDRVTITIGLPDGSWSVGQRVDAEIIFSRARYDFTVPVSALRSDNGGYFLLIMAQRNTVLGLQNIVERVNVAIVAADDRMVSVRGPVSRDSRVIIGSNKAVSVGDRIRVNE